MQKENYYCIILASSLVKNIASLPKAGFFMAGIEQYIQRLPPEQLSSEIGPGFFLTLQFLSEFTQTPSPSGEEGEMRKLLVRNAESMGWSYERDGIGNLLIEIPATAGYENASGILLQGHMDMKCEKEKDARLDPAFAGVTTVLDETGQWLSADKTTLGADNKAGEAIAMALAMDEKIVHGPLALLFTVQEERGLVGVRNMDLKNNLSRYHYLINLDSETWGEGIIGGAGGADTEITLPVERENRDEDMSYLSIEVKGGLGGHSGVDIDKRHSNAIKILAAALSAIQKENSKMRLVGLRGGVGRGSIPPEAQAVIAVDVSEGKGIETLLHGLTSMVKSDFPEEAELEISSAALSQLLQEEKVMTRDSTEKVIKLLEELPHGPQTFSRDYPEVVETSNNLALLETTGEGAVKISMGFRSLVDEGLEACRGQIQEIADSYGARADYSLIYNAWTPDPSAPLNSLVAGVYQQLFGQELKVKPIHAGLECGLIRSDKFPHLQVFSLGPTIENAHTTRERLYLPSLADCYRLVKAVIEKVVHLPDTGNPFPAVS